MSLTATSVGEKIGYDIEREVKTRYAAGAREAEAALCCPVTYDPKYLKILPKEIIERDYGCGDPSEYVSAGETVLDLGSGGGKICYILAQKVGTAGSVIGRLTISSTCRLLQPSMTAASSRSRGTDSKLFRIT